MPRNEPASESVAGSLSQLATDGRAWLHAEAALARAHIAGDGRRLAYVLGLIVFGLIAAAASLMLLVLSAVVAMAPYVGGLANAAGLLGLFMGVAAALLIWATVSTVRVWPGATAVFRRWTRILSQGLERAS